LIKDKNSQISIWIHGEGFDFTETACQFFDDANADLILEKYSEFKITEAQYFVLKEFRDRFRYICDEYSEAFEFIDTPEWAEIMGKAKDVLKAFNFVKKPYSSRPQKLDD